MTYGTYRSYMTYGTYGSYKFYETYGVKSLMPISVMPEITSCLIRW